MLTQTDSGLAYQNLEGKKVLYLLMLKFYIIQACFVWPIIFPPPSDAGIWSKVTCAGPGPSARFSVAGDCLDLQKGILVFIGGCNESLEALDDMYYLYTGLPIICSHHSYIFLILDFFGSIWDTWHLGRIYLGVVVLGWVFLLEK